MVKNGDSGPLSQTAAIAKVRYRKDPHMQNSMCELKLILTLVLTLTDTGGAVLTLIIIIIIMKSYTGYIKTIQKLKS